MSLIDINSTISSLCPNDPQAPRAIDSIITDHALYLGETNEKKKGDSAMENKISSTFHAGDIRAVLTDCYGTIVEVFTENTPPGHQVWSVLSNFLRYHGYHYTPNELCERFFECIRKKKTAGQAKAQGEAFDIEERKVYQSLLPGANDALIQTAAQIFRAASTISLRLYPGVMRCLTDLRGKGMKICLMSNAQRIYTLPELNALKLTPMFDEINISSDTFFRKPSAKFFQIMVDRLGIPPEKLLMVGNHPGDDIVTAHKLGLRTCYINSNQSPENAPPPQSDIYDIYLNSPKTDDAPDDQMPWEILRRLFLQTDK